MTGAAIVGSIMNNRLGAHETLDLHEVTAFKALCVTKSKTMQALVADEDLRRLMRQDVEMSSRQLQELDGLLAKAIQ